MFKVLHELCNAEGLPITEFENLPVHSSTLLPDRVYKVLNQLCDKVEWKKNRRLHLLKRIQKLLKKKTFSTREVKLISKLVNIQKKQGKIDFDKILYYFPGKTIEM